MSETAQHTQFRRGPGGRPTRAEALRRHDALLATALRLFLDRGFDAVTIEEIARRVGVAKRFVYARYGDKSELFVAAIEHAITRPLGQLQAFAPPRGGAARGLTAFARRLIEIALEPDALALHRLFVTTAPRFPSLTESFMARNRHRAIGEIERVLAHYAERGEIVRGDKELMAEQFFICVVGIPQRLALLGLREPPAREARRLRAAVRLFLEGCTYRP